ncbi:hypothetical protein K488DRAFT_28201, partial [Vararia minispora EC-137]
GARLSVLSQGNAYWMIMASRKPEMRRQALINLDVTRHAVRQHNKSISFPKSEHVWRALYHKDFSRKTRDFLWRCMQGAFKIGRYWAKIPEYEQRERCSRC